jgi:hypothetical protein
LHSIGNHCNLSQAHYNKVCQKLLLEVEAMGKKAVSASSLEQLVAINFKVPRKLHDALHEAASALCLDLSSLLRMVLAEHVAEYAARGKKAAEGLAEVHKKTVKNLEKRTASVSTQ